MTSRGQSITVTFEDLTIAAHSNEPSHCDWLREFLEPDFNVRNGEAADCSVHVVEDAGLFDEALGPGPVDGATLLDCFALDSSVVRLPILKRHGRTTIVHDEPFEAVYVIDADAGNVAILARPGSKRVRASLLRVAREFAMNHLHPRGLFLHASAVARGDRGIAVAGRKAAGKTTVLTYLLSTGFGDYLSNDRVFVANEASRQVIRNIPTVISVRPGTLDLCPDFGSRFRSSGYSTYLLSLAEIANRPKEPPLLNQFGNYFLSPAQYRSLLDARQRPSAVANTLVFPVVCGEVRGFRIRELSTSEALDRLPDALLGAGGWRKGTEAFTMPGVSSAPDRTALAERSEHFCSAVRCLELRLGSEAYADGILADELATFVDAGAEPVTITIDPQPDE